MSEALKSLTAELDRDLKNQIQMRVEALMRGIKYLQETDDKRLLEIKQFGWSLERLEIICILNAFYQIVLGPLASSARERTGALGEEIPILYGELIRFDADRNRGIRAVHKAFSDIILGLPGQLNLITASHADDIVFLLNKALTQHGDD